MFFMLMPLADVAIAGFQLLFGWQTLSSFGEYAQNYAQNHPPDYNDISGWTSNLRTSWMLNGRATGVDNSTLQVICGDANPPNPCSQSNTVPPRRFLYQTTVSLPLMTPLRSLFQCSNNTPCSFPLKYSEPFQ
jgi:hypothetical protein